MRAPRTGLLCNWSWSTPAPQSAPRRSVSSPRVRHRPQHPPGRRGGISGSGEHAGGVRPAIIATIEGTPADLVSAGVTMDCPRVANTGPSIMGLRRRIRRARSRPRPERGWHSRPAGRRGVRGYDRAWSDGPGGRGEPSAAASVLRQQPHRAESRWTASTAQRPNAAAASATTDRAFRATSR